MPSPQIGQFTGLNYTQMPGAEERRRKASEGITEYLNWLRGGGGAQDLAALGKSMFGPQGRQAVNYAITGENKPKAPLLGLGKQDLLSAALDFVNPMAKVGGILGTLAGPTAKTANPVARNLAEQLKAQGKSDEDIWRITAERHGQPWWLGHPDQVPRFEISDDLMMSKPTKWEPYELAPRVKRADIGQALEHKELFSAYPELAGYNVALNPTIEGLGQWHRADPSIGLAPHMQVKTNLPAMLSHRKQAFEKYDKGWREMAKEDAAEFGMPLEQAEKELLDYKAELSRDIKTLGQGMLPKQDRSVMLHELQHGAQEIEGMARGGSPSEFKLPQRKQENLSRQEADLASAGYIQQLMKDKNLSADGVAQYLENKFGKRPSVGSIAAARNFTKEEIKNEKKYIRQLLADPSGAEQYRRLGGEMDARAVQARQALTEQERAKRPFWLDYDVPLSEMIIRR